jgi:hypothetical protein
MAAEFALGQPDALCAMTTTFDSSDRRRHSNGPKFVRATLGARPS